MSCNSTIKYTMFVKNLNQSHIYSLVLSKHACDIVHHIAFTCNVPSIQLTTKSFIFSSKERRSCQLRIDYFIEDESCPQWRAERDKYLYCETFYGGQKLHKYFSSLLIKDTSMLTCSYIGQLRNGRAFYCENERFIVFILILRRVLF